MPSFAASDFALAGPWGHPTMCRSVPSSWPRLLLVAALLAVALAGCSRRPAAPPNSRPLRIAAASSLKPVLEEVLRDYRTAHPDVLATVAYGSSGQFFAQISNEAPFDLFLSADRDYPDRLVDAGFGAGGGVFVYARGRLVVWAPRESPIDPDTLSLRSVDDPRIRKVALANPKVAPYGRLAEEALRRADLSTRVRDKLVLGDNAEQAAQFAHAGSADLALLPLSLALAPPLRSRGRCVVVPPDLAPPLDQAGLVLTGAADEAAARDLRDFLLGPDGRAALARHGYEAPPRAGQP